MERAVLDIPLDVKAILSEPKVSMQKLINMQAGDTFPILINEGIQFFIEDEKAFLGELGEVGINAAVNLVSRPKD
jgi:flagellar motor switch protein FliM